MSISRFMQFAVGAFEVSPPSEVATSFRRHAQSPTAEHTNLR